jgi:CHAT domain-containing protein
VLTAAAKHYFEFQLEQIGIDVTVRLLDSRGKPVAEVDSPNGSFGPERLFWISETDGNYRLEVVAPNKRAGRGKFRLHFVTNRAAIAQDRNAVTGQQAYLEALKLSAARRYPAADQKYAEAIARLNSAGKRQLAAQAMRVYGASLYAQDRFELALQQHQSALAVVQGTGDRVEQEYVLDALGQDLKRLGRYAEAAECYRKALSIQRQVKDPALLANTLHDFGSLYLNSGNYRKAASNLEQSLGIYRRLSRTSAVNVTLGDLGTAYNFLGQYDKGRSYCEQAVEATRAAGRAGVPALICAGNAYRNLEEFDKALDAFEQAQRIVSQTGERRTAAVTNADLAFTYWLLGEYPRALLYWEQTLETSRELEDKRTEAATLNSISHYYRETGDYPRAIESAEQALAIARSLNDRRVEADTLSSLGRSYAAIGQHDAAMSAFQQALKIYQALKVRLGEVVQFRSLSSALILGRDYRSAIRYANRGLPMAYELSDLRDQALLLNNLMIAWSESGNPRLAILFGKQAVNALQQVRKINPNLAEESRRSFISTNASVYRKLADLMISIGRLTEAQQVLDLLKEHEYVQFLRGEAESSNGTLSLTNEEAVLESRYAKVRDQLVAIGKRRGDLLLKPSLTTQEEAELNRLDQAIEAGNFKFESVVDSIAKQFAANQQPQDRLGRIREMRGIMGELRNLPVATVLIYTLVTEDRYRAVLFTPDVQKSYEYRISSADLNRKVHEFRGVVQDPREDPLPASQEVYRILVGPELERDLRQSNAQVVMWMLDGVLRYVPVAALHDGKHFLLEQYTLAVFTPAGSARLQPPAAKADTVIGFGVSKPYSGFPALENVPSELAGIVRANDSPEGLIPGEKQLNEVFTSGSFRSTLRRRWPLVHIASHFHFQPGSERQSFLLLGDGSPLTLAEFKRLPNIFENVQLLTLSACETGVGDSPADGTEVEAFGVLAQRQGASAVISTLWSVADESTSALMTEFYRLWTKQPNMLKAEALRQAQIEMLRGTLEVKTGEAWRSLVHPRLDRESPGRGGPPYAHPFYWAPFFMLGNWL